MKKAFDYTLNPNEIPATKVVAICDDGGPTVRYACPDSCWQDHMRAWRRARQNGHKTAPEPMPEGHCMFDDPTGYACVPWDDQSDANKRKAFEARVRGDLRGWDQFLFDAMPEKEAMAKLDAIVRATVEAKMRGADTGAFHFLACVSESV